MELDEGIVRVKLRVRLFNLVELRLRDLKLCLRLPSAPLPLLRTLPRLKQALAGRLSDLLMVGNLHLELLHASLESRMFALEDLAAITDSPELLQLLGVDLADNVREELNLLRSLTKFIPVTLLCG